MTPRRRFLRAHTTQNQETTMSTTPTPTFEFYADPADLPLSAHSDFIIMVGAGSFDGDRRPAVSLDVPVCPLYLAPSEARALGQQLIDAIDSDDEGRSLSTSSRPGQTFPVSSPLDTLKHTTLRVLSLLDVALDRLAGEHQDVADLLDATRDEVLAGLREHVTDAGQARTSLAYDNGAPVRLLVQDGGVVHELMPRVDRRAGHPDQPDAA